MKNTILSIIIIAFFIIGGYFIVKNAPERSTQSAQTGLQTQMIQDEEIPTDAPQMTILQEGSGDAVSKNGDTLGVVYIGYLTSGEVFDTNVGSEENYEFVIGAGQVIAGWEIGLLDMKVGEIRRLILPPSYAYGENAVGMIPPNSTLIFDVELLEIK